MSLCMGCMTEKGWSELCPNCGLSDADLKEANPSFLTPGTRLVNRYIVGVPIGQGGFGITYNGYDKVLKVKVAIKEYYPNEIAGRNSADGTVSVYSQHTDDYYRGQKRFVAEAKTLAKFADHPCIVGVIDCFSANNSSYMVMEFLDGVSLKEYLSRKGDKLSVKESIALLTPVMDALKAVHAEGIIHRDVSPDNIFITTDGRVRLIDFGAARQSIGGQKSLSVILKPGYAPEEQYRTRGNQGPWTDIYALTATFYRMITGCIPPDSLERVMQDTLRIPADLPQNIQTALRYGLAIRVQDRYRSVAQLQEMLAQNTRYDSYNNGRAEVYHQQHRVAQSTGYQGNRERNVSTSYQGNREKNVSTSYRAEQSRSIEIGYSGNQGRSSSAYSGGYTRDSQQIGQVSSGGRSIEYRNEGGYLGDTYGRQVVAYETPTSKKRMSNDSKILIAIVTALLVIVVVAVICILLITIDADRNAFEVKENVVVAAASANDSSETKNKVISLPDLYSPGRAYKRMNIGGSELVTSENEYNEIRMALDASYENYENFVASGSRTKADYNAAMSPCMDSGSDSKAYDNQWSYFNKYNITSYEINSSNLNSIRKKGDTYFAWVTESFTETKSGRQNSDSCKWVYRLKKTDRGIVICDYIADPVK